MSRTNLDFVGIGKTFLFYTALLFVFAQKLLHLIPVFIYMYIYYNWLL